MVDWLIKNKEWFFSGIGVALLSWLVAWIFHRKNELGQSQSSGSNSVNLQAGNDINIGSKDD